MDDVRSRIRSHLTALSAASVIVACNHRACGKTDGGYGVVDPLPPPSCVDKSMPTATAVFVEVSEKDAGLRAKDASPTRVRAVRFAIKLDIEGAEYKGTDVARGDLLEEKKTPEGVELLVLPRPAKDEPSARPDQLDLTVHLTCSVGPSTFHVRLPLDGDGGEPKPEVQRW